MVLSSPVQWINFKPDRDALVNFTLYFLHRIVEDLLVFVYVKFGADTLRFEKVFMFVTKGVQIW